MVRLGRINANYSPKGPGPYIVNAHFYVHQRQQHRYIHDEDHSAHNGNHHYANSIYESYSQTSILA